MALVRTHFFERYIYMDEILGGPQKFYGEVGELTHSRYGHFHPKTRILEDYLKTCNLILCTKNGCNLISPVHFTNKFIVRGWNDPNNHSCDTLRDFYRWKRAKNAPKQAKNPVFCLDKHVKTENFFMCISNFMWNIYEFIGCKINFEPFSSFQKM